MFLLPAVCLATMIGTSPIGASNGDNANTAFIPQTGNSKVIIQQVNSQNFDSIKAALDKLGVSINTSTNCPEVIIPNCKPNNKPGGNKPGTNKPGTDKPDNKPGTDKPDNKPEIDKPDNNKPGTDNKPGIENPDNKPGTDKPDNDTSNQNYASQVVTLVNAERQKAGLSPLTMETNITAAAQVRAKEIVSSFSHTRPNGSQFSTALTENSVNFRGSGENIAWGQKTPEAVVTAWMNSAGHRANILNKNFTSIGVGYYTNASGTAYWTQLFTY